MNRCINYMKIIVRMYGIIDRRIVCLYTDIVHVFVSLEACKLQNVKHVSLHVVTQNYFYVLRKHFHAQKEFLS